MLGETKVMSTQALIEPTVGPCYDYCLIVTHSLLIVVLYDCRQCIKTLLKQSAYWIFSSLIRLHKYLMYKLAGTEKVLLLLKM